MIPAAPILLAIKALAILGLSVYALFAAIIIRQEQLMADVLEEEFEPFLRMLAIVHFIASLVVVFLAFVLL